MAAMSQAAYAVWAAPVGEIVTGDYNELGRNRQSYKGFPSSDSKS
jgi:hypothetical protein